MTINERILLKIKDSGFSPKQLKSLTGIDKSTISRWKDEKYKPSVEAIVALSQLLNVTTDYFLLGKEEESPIIVSKELTKDALSIDERNIINTYREIDDDGKETVQNLLRQIWKDHYILKGNLSNTSADDLVG